MADAQRNSVLRRKAEAGRTSVVAARQVTPCKALSTAFVQTMDKRLQLVATVGACSARMGTLAELLDTLPEGGLFAVLEGAGDAQGLMVFDPGLLSSVIEQLMMGRLSARPPAPRRPTRTDAALTADLVDVMLRRFETPFLDRAEWRWLGGFGYATYLDDPRPLGLMLEDVDYRILTLTGELAGGTRSSKLMLALPTQGASYVGTNEDTKGTPTATAAAETEGALPWRDAFEERVLPSRASMTAVLHRMPLPIASIESLKPGMELPIPGAALDETALLGVDGAVVARGRLGQSNGRRAVRLAGMPAPEASTPKAGTAVGPAGTKTPPLTAAAPEPEPKPDALPPLDVSPVPDLAANLPEAGAFDPPPLPDLPDLDDLPEPDIPSLPALDDLPEPEAMDLPALDELPKI